MKLPKIVEKNFPRIIIYSGFSLAGVTESIQQGNLDGIILAGEVIGIFEIGSRLNDVYIKYGIKKGFITENNVDSYLYR